MRGAPPSIEWVAVGELLVDDSYQRSIETEPSRRLIASMPPDGIGGSACPWPFRAEKSRYVIDGQHRLAAAKLRRDIPHLPCSVATYDGAADEAGMFVAANRARRAINRLDDFHAALIAGDEDAIEVNRVVVEAGLRVSRHTGSQAWVASEVAFTSSIQTVLSRHGEEVAGAALTAIASAFEGQILSNGASVFLGVCRILVSPPEGLDRDRLFRSLKRFNMKEWGDFVQGVKGGDLRAQVMRQALLEAYAETVSAAGLVAV